MQNKKCGKCGEVKARSEFRKNKGTKDGLKGQCKACSREYDAKYRVENAESLKAKSLKYRGMYVEAKRDWRKANTDKMRTYSAKWHAANPDKARSKRFRRRARLANATGDHTAEQLKARFDYHGNKCVYCDSTENLHADHQIPLSRGGTNFASNMVPACATCNKSKGSKTPEEFLEYQFRTAMERFING